MKDLSLRIISLHNLSYTTAQEGVQKMRLTSFCILLIADPKVYRLLIDIRMPGTNSIPSEGNKAGAT